MVVVGVVGRELGDLQINRLCELLVVHVARRLFDFAHEVIHLVLSQCDGEVVKYVLDFTVLGDGGW